jgi:hypothetical protein
MRARSPTMRDGRRRSSLQSSSGGSRAAATTRWRRYLHAEHDNVDELLDRIDEVRDRDLNAIRLRR